MPVVASFVIAETGHADTHEGSTQCMHDVLVNAKPSLTSSLWAPVPSRYALITLSVLPEMSSGASQ